MQLQPHKGLNGNDPVTRYSNITRTSRGHTGATLAAQHLKMQLRRDH